MWLNGTDTLLLLLSLLLPGAMKPYQERKREDILCLLCQLVPQQPDVPPVRWRYTRMHVDDDDGDNVDAGGMVDSFISWA